MALSISVFVPSTTCVACLIMGAACCRVEDDSLPCDGVHYAIFSLWNGAAGHPDGVLGTFLTGKLGCAVVQKRPAAETRLAAVFLQGSLAA